MASKTSNNGASSAAIVAIISGVAAFLIFLPTLGFDFTNWDDHVYVYENPNIRSLDLKFLSWVFTAVVHANWHPLTMLSLAFDYAAWGLDPRGFHLTNVVINALNAALVSVLALALARSKAVCDLVPGRSALVAAITTGLLFAAHPLHVESVAWISERKDVLSLFFFLLAVLAYVKYASSDWGGRAFYAISIIFVALSLMSKPMAVSAPFVLLLLDYYPLARLTEVSKLRKLVIEKAPFFALSTASAIITLWAQGSGGAIRTLDTYSLTERLLAALSAYFFYFYKLLLPINLAPVYPYPEAGSLVAVKILVLFAVLALVTFAAVYLARGRKIFASAWLYYLITLLPVIGIVQVGNQGAADRYMYMPGIAFFLLAGAFAGRAWHVYQGRGRAVSAMVVLIAFALLSFLTVRQEVFWKDSLSLWTRQIGLYPDTHMAYNLRGNELLRLGRSDEALGDYAAAIAIDPTHADPYYNRAFLYQTRGEFVKAVDDYGRVLAINKDYFKAYMNRGISYAEMGMAKEAVEDFTSAISIEPDVPEAVRYRAITFLNSGDAAAAIHDYELLIYQRKAIGDDFFNLARAYDEMGERARAVEILKRGAMLGHGPSQDMLQKLGN